MVREEILDLLAANPGEYVSGELMSEHLQLTVSHLVTDQSFKGSGFEIEANQKGLPAAAETANY